MEKKEMEEELARIEKEMEEDIEKETVRIKKEMEEELARIEKEMEDPCVGSLKFMLNARNTIVCITIKALI